MENQDKILDFILIQISTSIWKKNRDHFPVADIQKVAQQFKLNDFDSRAFAQKMIHLTIYEEALNCATTEELVEKVLQKLQYHPYCNSYVITRNVARKGFDVNSDLDIYRGGTQVVSEENQAKVLYWLVDICCYYFINTKGPEIETETLINLITEKVTPFIKMDDLSKDIAKKLNILKWDKFSVRKVVATKFTTYTDVISQLYAHFFEPSLATKVKQVEVVEKSEECSFIESLIDSICDIDLSTAEKEQDLIEVAQEETTQEVQEVQEVQPTVVDEVEPQQEIENIESSKEEMVNLEDNKLEEALKTFCATLGYTVQKEESLRYVENKETKLIVKLLDPRIGAPLSQLYNTYNSLEQHSLDNIGAVLSTFFTSLEALGFEFNEETYKVGDTLIVNSKEAGKSFRFSKPITSDGEVEVCVEHLETLYQNKRLTQMIVKPIQA